MNKFTNVNIKNHVFLINTDLKDDGYYSNDGLFIPSCSINRETIDKYKDKKLYELDFDEYKLTYYDTEIVDIGTSDDSKEKSLIVNYYIIYEFKNKDNYIGDYKREIYDLFIEPIIDEFIDKMNKEAKKNSAMVNYDTHVLAGVRK